MSDLRAQFGSIDIYVFDQLLRERITPGRRVLDAGCGAGRNLVYMLRHGYDVTAVDRDPDNVARARSLAVELGAEGARVLVADIEALPFADAQFDVVICCAVLHFAPDHAAFQRMVQELGRVLAPGGLLFARLASRIGLEHPQPRGGGRYRLPDGSERYLVDEAQLMRLTTELGGELADPLKTTIVQGQRCMTTWCVRKRPPDA